MSKVFTITEGLENMGALRTGGQGSVYKGRRMGPVISAVKLLPTPIHTEDSNDKNFRNFQNEVEKLKKVNEIPNPNVVKIFNSGLTESGSFPYIEMEFIEGPDLEELLKPPHDGIFTLKEARKLAEHLSNALSHCHKIGVKHGDVKSNNVKLNINSGNYVLLDFGLAIMSDEQRRTSIRHAGAIEFMAPEQNTGAMLFQTDVYSYGIILFELLAGQVPFPLKDSGETSRNTVMVAHMESPVPDLMELRSKNLPTTWSKEKREQEMRVPNWLLKLIATCLEKKPENRYPNGIALHDAYCDGSLNPEEPVVSTAGAVAKTAAKAPVARLTVTPPDKMLISKPLFVGLMGLLLLSLGTTGYMLFDRTAPTLTPVIKTTRDSVVKPQPDTSTVVEQPVETPDEKRKAIDSATEAAIRQDLEKPKQEKKKDTAATFVLPDSTNKQQ